MAFGAVEDVDDHLSSYAAYLYDDWDELLEFTLVCFVSGLPPQMERVCLADRAP